MVNRYVKNNLSEQVNVHTKNHIYIALAKYWETP